MKKKVLYLSLTSLIFLPCIALAVGIPGIPAQIGDFNVIINGILNLIWPLFIGFAVIMFIIAGFFFVRAQGEPGELKVARDFLIWGVVGVMVGVLAFTIPYFIQGTILTGGAGGGGGGTCSLLGSFCSANANCCNSGNIGPTRAICLGGSCRLCKGFRAVCANNGECCNGTCAPGVNTGTTPVCN